MPALKPLSSASCGRLLARERQDSGKHLPQAYPTLHRAPHNPDLPVGAVAPPRVSRQRRDRGRTTTPTARISTRQHPIQCHRLRSPCSHGGKRPTHHHASMNACREKSVLGGTGREGRGNSPRNTRDSPRVACRCAKRLISWASRTGPASGPQSRNRALLQWRAGVSRSPRP